MNVFLSLGSNLGDRHDNLRRAIAMLEQKGNRLLRVSPVIETPALLPEDAPWEWNMPFLNMAIEMQASCTPEEFRGAIADIQTTLGRSNESRWSPRPVDIDILLWGREIIETDTLTIPHLDLHRRHFVLTPMIALEPTLTIPGKGDKTLLEWSLDLPHHMPLWMGIVNTTPDSFSDGGSNLAHDAAAASIDSMIDAGVNIIDIGGESTRPGASEVDHATEWSRVAPALEHLRQRKSDPLRPLISLDTRHAPVAANGLEAGVDIINDVSGLTDPAMIELAQSSTCEWIAMHSLSVPASADITLPADKHPVDELRAWLDQRISEWDKAGISLNRIIFDIGIGFGKNSLQSLKLLQAASEFRRYGLRLLVGHSRKSFMRQFASANTHERDMVTIGAALHLCQQGVDIIRVHNVADHLAAYRGWSHLAG
jgi:2-amino-4-hydroxy-6-hydroxymethyldihydropteridine diphosphokinase/dihydropteroate synthase